MDRHFDPGGGPERGWRGGDGPDPFALGHAVEDDDESDEEESSSLAYGSLLSLGGSLRKKQPCIIIDAEEAEQGLRLVQHAASHQFDAIEEAGLGRDFDRTLPPPAGRPEPEYGFSAEGSFDQLPLAPAAIDTWFEEEFAAEERQAPVGEPAEVTDAMPLLPASEPETIDDFRLAAPPVFEFRNGLRRKLIAVQATASPRLRLVQLLRRVRRWARRRHF